MDPRRDAGEAVDASTPDASTRSADAEVTRDAAASSDASVNEIVDSGLLEDLECEDATEVTGASNDGEWTELAAGTLEPTSNLDACSLAMPSHRYMWTAPEAGLYVLEPRTTNRSPEVQLSVRYQTCEALEAGEGRLCSDRGLFETGLDAGDEVVFEVFATAWMASEDAPDSLDYAVGVRRIELVCENGMDDDNDGAADCEDSDCGGREPCIETDCDDDSDGDGDGKVDCEDEDCGCFEICDNGIDDDENGLTDCDDEACESVPDLCAE